MPLAKNPCETRSFTDMFAYAFMRKALLVGLVLSLALPLIGVPIVLRRTSMTGDALAHSSLAGVAAGLVMGIDPVVGALVFCIISALTIEGVRRNFSRYSDLAIAVVSAVGAGLAGILSSFAGTSRSLDDFLFGSIVAVSDGEVAMVVVVGLLVILFSWYFKRDMFLLSLDTSTARTSGVKTNLVLFLFSLVTGAAISISARAIGSLVVSSVLVLPVACALQLSQSYKQTIALSLTISVVSVLFGIVLSYLYGLRPGGTIVLIGAAALVVAVLVDKHVKI